MKWKTICRIITIISLTILISSFFEAFLCKAETFEEEVPATDELEKILISDSCEEAIAAKVEMRDLRTIKVESLLTLDLYEPISEEEFYQNPFVTKVYMTDDQSTSVGLRFIPGLSLRERASFYAEDIRVKNMYPLEVSTAFGWNPEHLFVDVWNQNAYYYNSTYWARVNDISYGYEDLTFGVGRTCTRGEYLTLLWRLKGRPTEEDYPDPNARFYDMADCSVDTDLYRAVSWAIGEGVVKGFSDGGFHPDADVNRKDALIMLYRSSWWVCDGEIPFADVMARGYAEDSDTYKAIAWATKARITKGYADGSFRPMDPCLREQVITFLYRWYTDL